MRDITSDMMGYLEARRHLWNVHFREKFDSLVESSALDEYEYIDKLLFLGLVLRDLGVTSYPDGFWFGITAIKEVKILPKRDHPEIPFMLERETEDRNYYWEKKEMFSSLGLELEFIEFFEWGRYDFVSYPMVMGRIVKFDDHKEYIGRLALIETTYVRFVTKSKKYPPPTSNKYPPPPKS